jgi:capsular exopolysaccharide synthesis family protein
MKGKGYDLTLHNDIERAAAFLNQQVPARRQHYRSTSSERGLVAVTETLTASPLDDEADKFDLLSRLRRHKLFFCGIFLLTLGFMGAIYVVAPRTYQGQASIILAAAEPVLRGVDPVVEQRHGDPADLQSQALVLHSVNLLQGIAAQPEIATLIKRECQTRKVEPLGRLREIFRPADCDRYETDKVAAAEYLQSHLGVSEDGRSRVINVAYTSPIPESASIIPNSVVKAYLAARLEDQLNSRLVAVSWLRSEIARVSGDLTETEARIAAFQRQHDLMRGETSSLDAEQLTLADRELASARAAQSEAAAQLAQVTGGAAENAPVTLQNRAINDVKQELSRVASQAAALESIHGNAYPQLVALRKQEAALNVRLNREMARVAASLRQTHAATTAKVATLERQFGDAKRRVTAATNAQTEIANLRRHADVQHELYVDLRKKVDALEIERRVLTGNTRVVSDAQYPDAPASPRKLSFALGGLMLAVASAAGATLMLDRGDRTVRTKRSLERVAGVPVLGHIPALRPSKLASCRKVMTPCALQEAARQLFANCVLMYGKNRPRSILVTSAVPKDGKTFVTLALAQFVARSGRQVLAVEGDLRRPDFERALSIKPAKGLSDYLRGDAKLEEVLFPGGIPGLDVIVAGTPTYDSTELISNGRVADLLSSAHDRYDLVLMDGPPTEVLADSYLLAKEVDGVLFCVRWGISDMRTVTQAIHQLTTHGARVLGLAIDRVVARQLPLYEKYEGYGLQYPSQLD